MKLIRANQEMIPMLSEFAGNVFIDYYKDLIICLCDFNFHDYIIKLYSYSEMDCQFRLIPDGLTSAFRYSGVSDPSLIAPSMT